MSKRFNSFDVRAMVQSLRSSLIGFRVSNIYDLNPKTYLLKLALPDKKIFLLIESGIRFHTTLFSREKEKIPSNFTLKLRKHIRTKRLEDIQQLGFDRVVIFTFGSGPATQHLIVELYASGNVILTDASFGIETLLRTHKYDEDVIVATHQVYPTQNIRQLEIDMKKLEQDLLTANKNDTLKQVLTKEIVLGGTLVEHAILEASLNPQMMMEQYDTSYFPKLMTSFQTLIKILDQESKEVPKGYIILKESKKGSKKKGKAKGAEATEESKETTNDSQIYDEFIPFLYNQYKNKKYLEFSTFDLAVDDYYSKAESQKIEIQHLEQEQTVLKKLEKVKLDQNRRIKELKSQEDFSKLKADLIQINLQEVERAILIIRSAISSSMDWNELWKIVKEEKKKGDPIAGMIHKLKLENNQFTMLLSQNLDECDEDTMTAPAQQVDIDISLTAYSNARKYYDLKKKVSEKAKKTIDVADTAIKQAEKKTRKQLKEVKLKTQMQHIRKTHWFEKFYWFISTENYLILSGRDAPQNEILFKRYLKKGDIYVHADIHGASTCIIKNPTGEAIPPNTLSQAGLMSMCRSVAWNEKVVTSAWWVYDHQVSKTAPSGEYLTTGSFMIRGKKNYLPPQPLVMGFGFFFKLHESCIAKHLHERSFKSNKEDQEEDMEEIIEEEIIPENLQKTSEQNEIESEEKKLQEQDEQEIEVEKKESTKEKTKSSNAEVTQGESLGFGVDTNSIINDLIKSQEEEQAEEQESSKTKSKKMSTKERKLLKKNKTQESNKDAVSPMPAATKAQQENKKEKTNPNPQLPRGKKGKMKKIKEKYFDQDEEERTLKMQLLGHNVKIAEEEVPQVEEKPKICYHCGQEGHLSITCLLKKGKESHQEESKQEDKQDESNIDISEMKESEREEIKRLLQEENIQELDEEDKEKLTELDSLTGKPLPDDVLLYAIPVCSPYSAISNFKYKVKLTPGNMKKGVAIKTALSKFLQSPDGTAQEKDLLKSVSEGEMIMQMLSGIKLQAPGLQQKKKKK